MANSADWRLQGQERYLKGVELCFRAYRPYPRNDKWEHDHCCFCWAEFAVEDAPNVLHEGYCTPDEYRWICSECFNDFKQLFEWRLVAAGAADA
jgi:hypothetical protein